MPKVVLLLVLLGLGYAVWFEAETSTLQSRLLSDYARRLTYQLQPGGITNAVRYPRQGPFDERLGYTRLPVLLPRLQVYGMQVERRTVFSPELLRYVDAGFHPPYREKSQVGLTILDSEQQTLFRFRYPRRGYDGFGQIPEPVVNTLLFIENRDLLNERNIHVNPAVDWGRFLKAAFFKVGDAIHLDAPSMGGSTLATQIEKYRHSEDGVTSSIKEKLRQIASASVRIYQQGPDTLPARRTLLVEYLNTVPLAAAPGYGEVNGIGDGLYVWFGANFDRVNELLSQAQPEGELLAEQGLALRQVTALMIAHRRPTHYLLRNREVLARLTDSYLRLLGRNGAIGHDLMNAALTQRLSFREFPQSPAVQVNTTNKGVNVVRNRLVSLLKAPLYDLDRYDLIAHTSLDKVLQEQVTDHLRSLREEAVAQQNGLVGEYLLRPGQSASLNYSFTLFQSTAGGNQVRVQTDNTDIPFDINEGSKLELGSTAKLRVLASYLGVMAELHQRYVSMSVDELARLSDPARDPLSRWVLEQLTASPGLELTELLQRSLDRRYSASPSERFFTGGGYHTFGNFKPEDNGRVPTVRESLQQSINLPFVRILRDVIRYITYLQWSDVDRVLKDDSDARRREVLARFIDREGSVFLRRFWVKYQNKTSAERLDTLLSSLNPTPVRLAVVYRYLFPEGDEADFAAFLAERLPQQAVPTKTVHSLFKQYAPDAYSLQDQGYLARSHPLELWLLGYLERNADASYNSALDSSREQRQQVYNWLLRTKAKNARDSRVRTMLELEAFAELQRRWKQLGYPFDHLVPSLASALGSSGDRPAALAELMGIILNDGQRLPVHRINRLEFATDTPYEVSLVVASQEPEQVMRPEVAQALKLALADVVKKGTARRLQGVFHHPDGSDLEVGGKTGTGDNRLVTMTGGKKIKSRALSRTATLVFYLGDDHFGTLTAFVTGSEAKDFKFTSALPAQVLKGMGPILEPYLQRTDTQKLE
ncbi:MAG: penicillin-binding protein [Gammaproteobacteria bacterium]|nr:MAG: penicillin-binding protein [Gammaproteobacteria bacterium]